MKIKKEMIQQDSTEPPVIFHDVAACFFEEEWTLLNAWQKEFYRNVMKEIHQALISLGYRIVNPDTLVQVNKREEGKIEDPPDIERRRDNNDLTSTGYPAICPDILLRIKQEEQPYRGSQYDPKERVFSNCPSKGDEIRNIKRNAEDYAKTTEETAESENAGHTKEKEIPNCEKGKNSMGFCNSENSSLCYGDEIKNRKRNAEDYEKTTEETTQSENAEHAKEKEDMNYEKGIHSTIHLWTESNQELGGEKVTQQQSVFCYSENSSLCQGIPKVETHENNLRNAKCIADLQNTIENKSSYACAECDKGVGQNIVSKHHRTRICKKNSQLVENDLKIARSHHCTQCEKSFNHRGTLNRHLITHTKERPYQCSECEKSFSRKGTLNRHLKTHTKERPYHCSECEKRFGVKGDLIRHFLMHTGERPFQCTECEKCFRQAKALKIHIRTHTGERPYQCSECKKCFTDKWYLIRHFRIHTEERPFKCTECEKCFRHANSLIIHKRTHKGKGSYQCTECDKSFSSNDKLVSHQVMHADLRPYQCTKCLKSFSQRSHLIRHQKTHTDLRPYQCTECLKSFSRKSHLIGHRKTHTDLRLY